MIAGAWSSPILAFCSMFVKAKVFMENCIAFEWVVKGIALAKLSEG